MNGGISCCSTPSAAEIVVNKNNRPLITVAKWEVVETRAMVSCYLLSPVQLVTILNTTVLQMPCNNWLQHILHFKTSSGDLPKPKVWRAFLSTIWNEDQTGLEGEKGLLVTTAASNRKGSTIYLQSDCSEQAFAWVHTGKNGWLLAE